MVLPGVPRNERIKFVGTLVKLLFSEGLQGVTEKELADLNKLIGELLEKVEPVREPLAEELGETPPGGC